MNLTAAQHAQLDSLCAHMTLAEKVGQLLVVYGEGATLTPTLRQQIQSCHVGGLILYNISGNTESAAQVAALAQSAQAIARIPLWISMDQEGGQVVRLTAGVTQFPAQMAVAAAGSLAWAEAMSFALGTELRQIGINLTFSPVLDVNNNPHNPIIGTRSFGRDPHAVADWGRVTLAGYERAGIMTTAKHFPGHGDTSVDSHLGLPVVHWPAERLESIELYPFREAIAADVPAIMTAHLLIPAWDSEQPATLSPAILTGLLRERLGFAGLIITDSLTMGALESLDNLPHIAARAFLAGADILLLGADQGHSPAEQIPVYDYLVSLCSSGGIALERLEESVRRILSWKIHYGLFETTAVVSETPLPTTTVSTAAHQHLAQQIASASITAIPATTPLLPLDPSQPLLGLWPSGFETLGTQLAAYFPLMQSWRFDWSQAPGSLASLLANLPPTGTILLPIHHSRRYPQHRDWIMDLPAERTLVIITGSPYDLADSGLNRLITYGAEALCQEAVLRVLTSGQRPTGQVVF